MGTGNNRRASHPYDGKPTVQPTDETSDQTPGGPFTGPYYWVPRFRAGSLSWSILTGHDAGLNPDTGHTKLWLSVLAHLATDWGKDARALKRALGDHYTGLPRGRVTRSGTAFLINHGRDAPVRRVAGTRDRAVSTRRPTDQGVLRRARADAARGYLGDRRGSGHQVGIMVTTSSDQSERWTAFQRRRDIVESPQPFTEHSRSSESTAPSRTKTPTKEQGESPYQEPRSASPSQRRPPTPPGQSLCASCGFCN